MSISARHPTAYALRAANASGSSEQVREQARSGHAKPSCWSMSD